MVDYVFFFGDWLVMFYCHKNVRFPPFDSVNKK